MRSALSHIQPEQRLSYRRDSAGFQLFGNGCHLFWRQQHNITGDVSIGIVFDIAYAATYEFDMVPGFQGPGNSKLVNPSTRDARRENRDVGSKGGMARQGKRHPGS